MGKLIDYKGASLIVYTNEEDKQWLEEFIKLIREDESFIDILRERKGKVSGSRSYRSLER